MSAGSLYEIATRRRRAQRIACRLRRGLRAWEVPLVWLGAVLYCAMFWAGCFLLAKAVI